MGYRSEVYILVEDKLEEQFIKLLKAYKLGENIVKLPEEQQDTDGVLKYSGDWLKWYDGYPDVDAINGFIQDNYETCALICIGEDGAEHTRLGNPEIFCMYVVSKIEW